MPRLSHAPSLPCHGSHTGWALSFPHVTGGETDVAQGPRSLRVVSSGVSSGNVMLQSLCPSSRNWPENTELLSSDARWNGVRRWCGTSERCENTRPSFLSSLLPPSVLSSCVLAVVSVLALMPTWVLPITSLCFSFLVRDMKGHPVFSRQMKGTRNADHLGKRVFAFIHFCAHSQRISDNPLELAHVLAFSCRIVSV